VQPPGWRGPVRVAKAGASGLDFASTASAKVSRTVAAWLPGPGRWRISCAEALLDKEGNWPLEAGASGGGLWRRANDTSGNGVNNHRRCVPAHQAQTVVASRLEQKPLKSLDGFPSQPAGHPR